MNFFINSKPMLTTHLLRALNTGVFKTNQNSESGSFINEYFVYEVFCQSEGKLFGMKYYIY